MSDHQRPNSMTPSPDAQRLLELLADEAAVGLSDTERIEVDRLLSVEPRLRDEFGSVIERDAMQLPVGSLLMAMHGAEEVSLPAELRQRLVQSAGRGPVHELKLVGVAQPRGASDSRVSRRVGWAWSGWIAAAAAIVIAMFAWQQPRATSIPQSVRDRARALAGETGTVRSEWTALAEGPGITGEVVWNPARQEGYLRFRGLKKNDPSVEQYQLWIFDAERKPHPVDGGVFDFASGESEPDGTLVVPVSAKLRVAQAAAFAVTIEPPGGVVVSDQSRLVSIAKFQ